MFNTLQGPPRAPPPSTRVTKTWSEQLVQGRKSGILTLTRKKSENKDKMADEFLFCYKDGFVVILGNQMKGFDAHAGGVLMPEGSATWKEKK